MYSLLCVSDDDSPRFDAAGKLSADLMGAANPRPPPRHKKVGGQYLASILTTLPVIPKNLRKNRFALGSIFGLD